VELVRHKLDRSPLLREGIEAGGWHLVKANHMHDWAARDRVDLADLEPLLGLDPAVERTGDQLSLFGGGATSAAAAEVPEVTDVTEVAADARTATAAQAAGAAVDPGRKAGTSPAPPTGAQSPKQAPRAE
jgi:hypothetical protein